MNKILVVINVVLGIIVCTSLLEIRDLNAQINELKQFQSAQQVYISELEERTVANFKYIDEIARREGIVIK